jgi:hypothetical protein
MSRSYHPVPGAGSIRTTPLSSPTVLPTGAHARANLQAALDEVSARLARRVAEEDALRERLEARGGHSIGYSAQVTAMRMRQHELSEQLKALDVDAGADHAHAAAETAGGC